MRMNPHAGERKHLLERREVFALDDKAIGMFPRESGSVGSISFNKLNGMESRAEEGPTGIYGF